MRHFVLASVVLALAACTGGMGPESVNGSSTSPGGGGGIAGTFKAGCEAACKLASLDKVGYDLSPTDPIIQRYEQALNAFARICYNSKERLGHYAVAARLMLAKGGVPQSLLQILRHVRTSTFYPIHRISCAPVFADYTLGLLTPKPTAVGVGNTKVTEHSMVALKGGSFFTHGWGGGMVVDPQTVVDGVFLPYQWQWDQGAVWWDENNGNYRRRIVITLPRRALIDALILQGDNNDAYTVSARNGKHSPWRVIWNVPASCCGGMAIRPSRTNDQARHELPHPIVANQLLVRGVASGSDLFFSVSEVQAYGRFVRRS